MTEKVSHQDLSVLLLAFGGPDSLDSIEPFLESVLKGRTLTNEQVRRVKERYKIIGGKSPLLDITKSQARELQKSLAEKYQINFEGTASKGLSKHKIKVYVGMRHWHPFIKDTVEEIINDGVKIVVAISMAPHNSKASTGAYIDAMAEAVKGKKLNIDFVSTWHKHPLFLKALAARINERLAKFTKKDNVHVIFSAHSLPKTLIENDPYEVQLAESISGVRDIVDIRNYTLAFQSKGARNVEWLGPDVEDVLEKLSKDGVKDVLLVPFGFVADHVETLYDIDIVYKKKAESMGLNLLRTKSFNDSADFIEVLSSIASEKLDEYIED